MGEAGNREDAAPYNYPHFDDHIARGGDVTDEAAFRDSPWAGQRAEDFTLLRLNDGPRPGLPGYARTHEQTWSKPGPGTAVSGPSRTGIMPGQAAAPAPRPGPGPSHPPAAPRIHSALPGGVRRSAVPSRASRCQHQTVRKMPARARRQPGDSIRRAAGPCGREVAVRPWPGCGGRLRCRGGTWGRRRSWRADPRPVPARARRARARTAPPRRPGRPRWRPPARRGESLR